VAVSSLRDRNKATLTGPLRSVGPTPQQVLSRGGFEHFCSPRDYRAGRQEEICRRFFGRIAGVLPDKGGFYV